MSTNKPIYSTVAVQIFWNCMLCTFVKAERSKISTNSHLNDFQFDWKIIVKFVRIMAKQKLIIQEAMYTSQCLSVSLTKTKLTQIQV